MNPPPNFNRLARLYPWIELATFGPSLTRCRFTFLPELRVSRSAIVLGDGDGRFTARLLSENPLIQIDAVDASESMLRALKRNAGIDSARVRIHRADARTWQPPSPPYDLIVTHFFLDCLTTDEIAALAARLHSSLTPSALWVVSDFAVPPGRFGWLIARSLITGLYLAFGLLTGLSVRRLPDHRNALRQAGFALLRQHPRLGGLLVSELWQPPANLSKLPHTRPLG
jgi:hypothetical protein